MSQGHFMAKTLVLHQISCRVNQRTQLSVNRKWGDELCLAGKELSKQQCFPSFPKTQFNPDFGHSIL
jgi:protein involved in ribonucleotide reduction